MSHKPAVRAEVLALAPRIRSDDAAHYATSEAAAPRLEGRAPDSGSGRGRGTSSGQGVPSGQ